MKKRILIWVIVMVFAVAITRCATAQKAPEKQPETKNVNNKHSGTKHIRNGC